MGSAAVPVSPTVGRLLRRRRKQAGLTLRQASDRLAGLGEAVPESTLSRIEQGKLEPGTRRLYAMLRLYDIPPSLVDDLVELDRLADDTPIIGDPLANYQRGIALWKAGDTARGLAHMIAVRELIPENAAQRALRQKALHGFAIQARVMGKLRLAKHLIDELLIEGPVGEMRVGVLIDACSIWDRLGQRDAALGFALAAREIVDPADARRAGWVAHRCGMLQLDLGNLDAAERELDRARAFYGEADLPEETCRCLAVLARLEERRGERKRCYDYGRRVASLARELDSPRLRVLGFFVRGRARVAFGQYEEALPFLNDGLSLAGRLEDVHARFDLQYWLWKAHEALGHEVAAATALDAAKVLVASIDDGSPEASEVRAMT